MISGQSKCRSTNKDKMNLSNTFFVSAKKMTFQQKFIATVKQLEETVGGEERFYVVCCKEGDFHGVPMNIIYSARNPYGVWLKAYEYIRSKNEYAANNHFYSEERIKTYKMKKLYRTIEHKEIAHAVAATFESFIHGNTLWCEKW